MEKSKFLWLTERVDRSIRTDTSNYVSWPSDRSYTLLNWTTCWLRSCGGFENFGHVFIGGEKTVQCCRDLTVIHR